MFTLTVLGPKEAEMRIIGCDLHARQQTVAMLDTTMGEAVKMTLTHEGNNVREFHSTLPGPVRVGIEATGTMPNTMQKRYARSTQSQVQATGQRFWMYL